MGTAQWGSAYGVTNDRGRLTDDDVASIANMALSRGIRWVDTAAGYGDAQARLSQWSADFCITTKVSGFNPPEIEAQVRSCLRELGRTSVDACLIHDWDSLNRDTRQGAAARLEALRERGLIARVGVSIYEEAALASAADYFECLDVVQVPANVLDRRLENSRLLDGLASSGTMVQVRSVLLQGILAGPSKAPLSDHPDVSAFFTWCWETVNPPLAVALAHVRALPWATHILMGATSPNELEQVLNSWAAAALPVPAHIVSSDLELIDPRRWPNLPAL